MDFAQKFASRAALAAAGLALAALGAVHAQDPPRFAAGTTLVTVDVLVTRDGVPVDGLTATDFVVKEAGVEQKHELLAISTLPVNLLLALDTSASSRGPLLDHLKTGAKAAVAALRSSDQAALLAFSHGVALRAGWSANRQVLTDAIDAVTAGGGSAVADTAFAALGLKAQSGVRRLILFFTDGVDTASWLSPAAIVEAARRSESVVYAVTLAKADARPVPAELDQWLMAEPSLYRDQLPGVLASVTGGEIVMAPDGPGLGAAFAGVVARFNRRYVLTFAPSGAPTSGWHPIHVDVKQAGVKISARRGYVR